MTLRVGIDARKIADFGIGTYVRGLLSGLAEIAGPEQYVIFVGSTTKNLAPPGFETVAIDVPNYTAREIPLMGRAIARAGIDLFHSAHFVVPFTSRPVLTTIHDLIPFRFPYPNPLARLYFRRMIERAVRKSAVVLTVSEASRGEILRQTSCPPAKVVVTPNGIDPSFSPGRPGPSHSGRYLLCAGNDKPHKNIPRLLEAFAIVRRTDPSIRLIMTGAPFEGLRGRDGVEFAGFVSDEDLVALYRGATALVLPSLEEGFGLPALEAMACGTPVVTSQAVALMEVTGEAALHVDASRAETLAEAMLRISSDEKLRAELSHLGPERARLYSWRRCAELTREAYVRVARERALSGR